MEITVKTLDSQTKTFHVAPELTVKDFKLKVAEEMGIPTEKQRLIFQGKVLQDEKTLLEYKVDGCVIHLVEKQPPRNTRPNEQSTETTTNTTPSTTSQGNMFMGAFALPVDVMGVTQQIVQGIIQQIGAESAQANISTTSSGDGAAVNVHINLSTVMARNNARSRISPALVHLRHVSNIINRLQNDGMLSSDDGEETSSGSQSASQSENDTDCTPEDLADVLQRVVTLHEEIRPHLERYQDLLRASDRQLRPGDHILPDLTAEALHSLSHAYHALSDLTTNFGVPQTRLNVLPSVSPVPTPAAGRTQFRTGPVLATTATAATSTTGPAGATPSPTMTTRVNTGSSTLSGSEFLNGSGLFSGSRLLNGNAVVSSSAPTSTPGIRPGHVTRPFNSLPIYMRNLPNLAVQFNPAAGNITIAHIMTTTVDEMPPRATTTTTNSTPAPRTSSRGSIPVPPPVPPIPGSATRPGTGTPRPPASSTPATTTTTSFPGGQNNTVLNFLPPNAGHRDPLLPCQSFHFASFQTQTPTATAGSTGQVPLFGQQSRHVGQSREGQPEQQHAHPVGNATEPGPDIIRHLLNMGQGPDVNPFLEFFRPPPQTANMPNRYPGDPSNVPITSSGTHRTTTKDGLSMLIDEANSEKIFSFVERWPDVPFNELGQTTSSDHATSGVDAQPETGTLGRLLHRMTERHPIAHLIHAALGEAAGDPWIVMRPMTQDFLRNDILNGAESTPENLQRATETILDELKTSFDSTFASCHVKDNIDITATLLTYFRPKIRRILELVNSSADDEEYGAEMNDLLSRMASESIALVEYCLQDGLTGLETVFKRMLSSSRVLSQLEPVHREAVIGLWWSCIQDIRTPGTVREASVLPFVVRKEKRKHNGKTPSPKLAKKELKAEDSTSSNHVTSSSPSTSSTSSTSQSDEAEDVAMVTDDDWKKVIPSEWVPVISQDIIRQRRLPRQAPFSDAYINGMPPKRRRLMTPSEPAPYSHCVSATLKRSIAKAAVTPKTDIDLISREASSSPTLGKVFEQEVKNHVRERLSKDTDYQSEKFPSVHKYFEKDSNN